MDTTQQLAALATSLTAIGLTATVWEMGNKHRVYLKNKPCKIDSDIQAYWDLADDDIAYSSFTEDQDVLSMTKLCVFCRSGPSGNNRREIFFNAIKDKLVQAVRDGRIHSPSMKQGLET